MHYIRYIFTLFPIIFGAMGLFYFAIGIRGVVTRKPFLISYKWMIGMIFLCFLPFVILNIVRMFLYFSPSILISLLVDFNIMSLLNPLMIICLFAVMIIFRLGYIAFGITDSALREALHFVLRKKNLAFEETIGSIKLTSIQAELQVSMQSWIGTGSIRIKPFNKSKLLTEIVQDINIYFQENTTKTNLVTCIYYIVIAAFMLIFSFVFYLQRGSIKATANNQVAWKYAKENRNLDEALKLVDKAIAYKPTWEYLDTKAEILYKMKKYQDAVNIESDLVRRFPSEQTFQDQLKKFNKELNQPAPAQEKLGTH